MYDLLHLFLSEETLRKRGQDLFVDLRKFTDRLLLFISPFYLILIYFGIIPFKLNDVLITGWQALLAGSISLVVLKFVLPYGAYFSLAWYLKE